jgi:hypothetical protein
MFDWIVWTPVTMWMVGKAVALCLLVWGASVWYMLKTGRSLSDDMDRGIWAIPRKPRPKRTKDQGYSDAELQ